MSQRWEVQTRMILGDPEWENLWTIDDQPHTFATQEEAGDELYDHLADSAAAGLDHDPDEYRIVPVGTK